MRGMKKTIFLIFILMWAVMAFRVESVKAEEIYTITGTYKQTEARSMLDKINSFRTGGEAWYYNEDGTKNNIGAVPALIYDYNLEQAAMQRAMELIVSYDHTRPNGESCFTAYSGAYSAKGENIAIGTSNMTADAAYMLWREDDKDYNGQGHRRNMLDTGFGAVGIAHVYYKGCHYWVQEFGDRAVDTTKTAANDSETEVEISVDESSITGKTIGVAEEKISVNIGETKELPRAVIKFRTSETWSYAPDAQGEIAEEITWSSSDTGIVSIENSKMKGIKKGSAELTADYSGTRLKVTVSVDDKPTATGTAIDIKNAEITVSGGAFTYNGGEIKPEVILVLNKLSLVYDRDYTCTYSNNISAGTGTITIRGKGTYTGTAEKTFIISQAAISRAAGRVSQQKNSDGTYGKPVLELTFNGISLVEGTDFTAIAKSSADGKTVTIYAEGRGNFTGEYVSEPYTVLENIKPEKPSLKLGKSNYKFKYSKKARKFKLSVTAKNGKVSYKSSKAKVKVNKKGKVTIAKKFKGKAVITVILKGTNGGKITKKVTVKVIK